MSRGFPDTVSSTEIVESSAMQKKHIKNQFTQNGFLKLGDASISVR